MRLIIFKSLALAFVLSSSVSLDAQTDVATRLDSIIKKQQELEQEKQYLLGQYKNYYLQKEREYRLKTRNFHNEGHYFHFMPSGLVELRWVRLQFGYEYKKKDLGYMLQADYIAPLAAQGSGYSIYPSVKYYYPNASQKMNYIQLRGFFRQLWLTESTSIPMEVDNFGTPSYFYNGNLTTRKTIFGAQFLWGTVNFKETKRFAINFYTGLGIRFYKDHYAIKDFPDLSSETIKENLNSNSDALFFNTITPLSYAITPQIGFTLVLKK